MGILADYTGDRGPMYQVGYGIGELCAAWRMARKLHKIGCCSESVSQVLEMSAEYVEAARNLGNDEEAFDVLVEEVSSIVDSSFEDLLDSPLKLVVTLLECDYAKASIIDDIQIIS